MARGLRRKPQISDVADGVDGAAPATSIPDYMARYFASRRAAASAAPPLAPITGPACFGGPDRGPSPHQEAVRDTLRSMLKNKSEKRRGLLVWHGTGTGKTCTAALALDAFWAARKRRLFYVTTSAALALNPLPKIAKCMTRSGGDPDLVNRGVRALSFDDLAGLELVGDEVLVVDEAHHLLEPRFLRIQTELVSPSKRARSVIVVAMTATPAPFPEATLLLLNMLRPRGARLYELPGDAKSLEALRTRLAKDRLVSHYDASTDREHFAPVTYQEVVASGAKVGLLVDAIRAAPEGHRHMVWAPDGAGPAVAAGLRAAGVSFATLEGDVSHVAREFNRGDPGRGGVMLVADRRLGESVDLRGVRHIHVLDDAIDVDGLQQVIGRAWRFCSHAFLPAQDWSIDVKMYLPRVPGSVDMVVASQAELASRARGALVMMVGLLEEVEARTGIDVRAAEEEADALPPAKARAARARLDRDVRAAAARLKPEALAGETVAVWADLPKLRDEMSALANRLSEGDLRTLASVHRADRVVARAQAGADEKSRVFYDMLRAAST